MQQGVRRNGLKAGEDFLADQRRQGFARGARLDVGGDGDDRLPFRKISAVSAIVS
jgi:hypothetical protein